MDKIREEDIVCIIPANPSSPPTGFKVYHLSGSPPITLSITQVASTVPPHLVPYIVHLPQNFPSYLHPLSRRISIILSTKSGQGQAVQTWDQVIKPLLHSIGLNDESYHVLETGSDDSVREFAQDVLKVKAAEGCPQTVLLLSGDGGVAELLNGIMGGERSSKFLRPTLILFPLGTGNALFHSINRPLIRLSETDSNPSFVHDLVLALRTLFFGNEAPLPTFRATFSPGSRLLTNSARSATAIPDNTLYGAIVASYGLHATLVADSDTAEWRKKGPARFALVAQQLLSPVRGGPPHAYHARVTMQKPSGPETLKTTEHGYILLTLVSNLEKKFTISPLSEPLDGQLRLVHFGNETAAEVSRILGGAYQDGAHIRDPKVDYEPLQAAKIEFLEGVQVGESKGGDEVAQGSKMIATEDDEQGMQGRWRRVCIDGLIVRVEQGGWIVIDTLRRLDWPLQIVVRRGIQVDGT